MIDYDELRNEYVKCLSDKSRIYLIEHYLKTFDLTKKKEVPYTLFPRQKDLCITLAKGANVVFTKPRQAGATTTCGAYLACEMLLADKESPQTVLVIGNTIDLAQQMVTKIRDFLFQFPAWMWGDEMVELTGDPTKLPTKKQLFNICNTKELILKNGCRVVARSSGPDASRGVGGVNFLVFDETAFIENASQVYTASLPTVSTGGKIIMISTPCGKDPLYYETCRRAKLKGTSEWNNFELVEMKWYQDPRYNKFLEWTYKNEQTGEVEVYKEPVLDKEGNIKFDQEHWAELESKGWKPRSPWYIKMCQQFNNDSQKIAQELDVSFLGSASNVVDPEFIEMQNKLNVREPLYQDNIVEDTWVWKEPIEGHRYLCAVDNSRGDSSDRTAIEIIDLDGVDENGEPIIEQVLEYQGKKTGDDVGEMVYQYATAYGNAFVVVECIGGAGDATVLQLQRLGYKNLYFDDADLNKYTMQREVSSLKPNSEGKLPGFHSNAVRFQMLTHFANMVKMNQFKVRSKRVIAELDTWIYKGPAARIDHQDGAHDDTLTCLAMGLFVAKFSLDKLHEAKLRDEARLGGWLAAANLMDKPVARPITTTIEPSKKYVIPIYTSKTAGVKANDPYGALRWLIR